MVGILILTFNQAVNYLPCPNIWTYCLTMLVGAVIVTILYLTPFLNTLFPSLFKTVVTVLVTLSGSWGLKIILSLDKHCSDVYQTDFPSLNRLFFFTFGCTGSFIFRFIFKRLRRQ